MRILKKQKGFPFLIALGTLFLLSAGFIAVQLFSDDSRSAVQALETPLILPAMPINIAVHSKKASVKQQTETVVKQKLKADDSTNGKEDVMSKVTLEPVVKIEKKIPVKRSISQKPLVVAVVPQKKELKPKAVEKHIVKAMKVKAVKKEVKEAKEAKKGNVKVAANVKKQKTVAAMATINDKVELLPKAAIKSHSVKPKAVRRRKRIQRKIDESVVPPEWNWFDKPLRMTVDSGRVSITAKKNFDKTPKRVVVSMNRVSTKENSPNVKNESVIQKYEKNIDTNNAFNRALAKVSKTSARRVIEAKKIGIVLPSQGGVVRSKSLRALLAKLEAIRANGENRIMAESHNSAKVGTGRSVQTNEEPVTSVDVTTMGVNEYHGTGSSFSQKIQSLIRHGAWLHGSD